MQDGFSNPEGGELEGAPPLLDDEVPPDVEYSYDEEEQDEY